MKVIFLSFVILIQLWTTEIFALPDSPVKQNTEAGDNTQVMLNNKAMKKFLTKIEIFGRISKPQTVFIIPGVDPQVDGIRIERRFFSDMFRKVEKSTLRKQRVKEIRSKDHILW